MSKKHFTILPVFMLLFLLPSGCIYIPASESSKAENRDVFTEETLSSFKPGETSRADVLLRLGIPRNDLEHGRYFIYSWNIYHGRWVAFGWSYQGGGGGFLGAENTFGNYLALEFTPDNQLKRIKHFETSDLVNSLIFRRSYEELNKWMKDKPSQ